MKDSLIINKLFRPLISEVFELQAEYKHISDWNQRYEDDARQRNYDVDMNYGMDGFMSRGLKFEMRSWKQEAANRIVKSPGFVKLRYDEVFRGMREGCGAEVLYRRQV